MQAPQIPTHHIAAMLPPAWGHTISYMHAATQMLATEPGLVITIVQHNLIVPKMKVELKGSHDNLKARLRIIGVGDAECVQCPVVDPLCLCTNDTGILIAFDFVAWISDHL
ncbi:hypothetical protein DFH08DRAFT_968639 [Mycena albidolilacea]|uniref:Uncharacterized protein n=1 Tax=Mycena albidolilacea TaxID=1033008 RepID=A0AAD6ZJB2_9AGAR|nr:hypothetical protein DFH08DRAFT_968639 [Mycena albidolilacea]